MSHLLLDSRKAPFFESLFLGITETTSNLNRLLAHRFEATFLMRVLGTPPSEQSQYETFFRKFLAYANIKQLTMDWKLGLYFLEWAKEHNFVNSLDLHNIIVSRAAYRWINTPYHDRNYNCVIISDFPELPYWIIGQRSLHPLKVPKLFKAKPKDIFALNGIKYSLLTNIAIKDFNWQSI